MCLYFYLYSRLVYSLHIRGEYIASVWLNQGTVRSYKNVIVLIRIHMRHLLLLIHTHTDAHTLAHTYMYDYVTGFFFLLLLSIKNVCWLGFFFLCVLLLYILYHILCIIFNKVIGIVFSFFFVFLLCVSCLLLQMAHCDT